MMKKAFTLIEVNMAMLIMAGGIMSLVGLYSLGFRENSQSIEDVNGAAYADAVMSEVSRCLSDPSLTWNEFNSIQTTPQNGWLDYLTERNNEMIAVGNPNGVASTALTALNRGSYGITAPSLPSGWYWGLVVSHEPNSAVVTVAVRVAKEAKTLMAQPIYVTQVRFQGKPQ